MPLQPIQLIFAQLPTFALVLFRIAGLATAAPMMGALSIPIRIRVMLALVLAFFVFPLVPVQAFAPRTLYELIFGVATEMLIGITMQFFLTLVFLGISSSYVTTTVFIVGPAR